jgi:serpin B
MAFHPSPAENVTVDFLTTAEEQYRYVLTSEFEAVELPSVKATVLLVLPPADSSVEALEALLASNPDAIESLLAPREGDVMLPPFHFALESNLRNSLERLGLGRVFTNPQALIRMAPEGTLLTGVAQKTEITLDENGIRADSGMIFYGVMGGITPPGQPPPQPFHMILDRPFLFVVRDNATRALIFEGAVMNPALQ